jgi:hypothetical protein
MTLHQLPNPLNVTPVDEPLSHRMLRVRADAAQIAADHIGEFMVGIASTLTHAEDIADGGEAYSVGARDVARQLAMRLREAAQTLEALRRREFGVILRRA